MSYQEPHFLQEIMPIVWSKDRGQGEDRWRIIRRRSRWRKIPTEK
jgi:hypothetical protein